MNRFVFLKDDSLDGRLVYPKGVYFKWDGSGGFALYTSRKPGTPTMLHFQAGDAVSVSVEKGRIMATRIVPPKRLSRVVTWAIGAERERCSTDIEIFEKRLDSFRRRNRVMEPPRETYASIAWLEKDRCTYKQAKGPFLFLYDEGDFKLARYAKGSGRQWADVAAYCAPDISCERALELIGKYIKGRFPLWYIQNAIASAEAADAGDAFEEC